MDAQDGAVIGQIVEWVIEFSASHFLAMKEYPMSYEARCNGHRLYLSMDLCVHADKDKPSEFQCALCVDGKFVSRTSLDKPGALVKAIISACESPPANTWECRLCKGQFTAEDIECMPCTGAFVCKGPRGCIQTVVAM